MWTSFFFHYFLRQKKLGDSHRRWQNAGGTGCCLMDEMSAKHVAGGAAHDHFLADPKVPVALKLRLMSPNARYLACYLFLGYKGLYPLVKSPYSHVPSFSEPKFRKHGCRTAHNAMKGPPRFDRAVLLARSLHCATLLLH